MSERPPAAARTVRPVLAIYGAVLIVAAAPTLEPFPYLSNEMTLSAGPGPRRLRRREEGVPAPWTVLAA